MTCGPASPAPPWARPPPLLSTGIHLSAPTPGSHPPARTASFLAELSTPPSSALISSWSCLHRPECLPHPQASLSAPSSRSVPLWPSNGARSMRKGKTHSSTPGDQVRGAGSGQRGSTASSAAASASVCHCLGARGCVTLSLSVSNTTFIELRLHARTLTCTCHWVLTRS